jgi:3-oxoacyl-[acyl-carrier protein] reductase
MAVRYSFSGQTAIVTGGSRGIGRAIATQLLENGATVWIWDIEPVELVGATALQVDVADPDDIVRAISHLPGGKVDILLNDAGCLGAYQDFERFTAADWQRIVQVNLFGLFEVTHQVLPLMRREGRGRIVNMGSLAGKEGLQPCGLFRGERRGDRLYQSSFPRTQRQRDTRQLRRAWPDRYADDPRSRQRGRRRDDLGQPARAPG